jgi:hypothetical protein
MAENTLGIPCYRVYSRGHGRRVRFDVWRCVDLGDNLPLKLSHEDSFDNYGDAANRARLDNEEEERSRG